MSLRVEMPSWHSLLHEIKTAGSTHDVIRRRYLKRLQKVTGRNAIAYYSGWLQKPNLRGNAVNDADKNGLMAVIHKLDRKKGLDFGSSSSASALLNVSSVVSCRRAANMP